MTQAFTIPEACRIIQRGPTYFIRSQTRSESHTISLNCGLHYIFIHRFFPRMEIKPLRRGGLQ